MFGVISAFFLASASPVSDTTCTPETAVKTTIAEIGANLDRYMQRCVTLSGPFTGIQLFGSVEGMYLTHRFTQDGNFDREASRIHRIGIYSPKSELRARRDPTVPRLTVTGRVDSCERKSEVLKARQEVDRAAGRHSVLMMGGYCHYFGGAVIDAVAWQVEEDSTLVRPTGAATAMRIGSLVSVPSEWPHRTEVEQAVRQFANAVRRGDRNWLVRAHDIRPNADGSYHDSVIRTLLDDPSSAFVQLRRGSDTETAIFVDRYHVEKFRRGELKEKPWVFACYCRSRSCAKTWPISGSDADNRPDRPHACTRVVWQDWPGGRQIFNTAPGDSRWLAESTSTAFRPN